MGSVAEGIEECNHILGQRFINQNNIGFGDAHILCKCTVTVNAHTLGVLAPLDVTVVAVAAVMAGQMTLTGNPLTDLQAGNTSAQSRYLAHIFVTDGHGSFDVLLRPGIPIINMYIRATNGSLVHLDQYFTGAGYRNRDFS